MPNSLPYEGAVWSCETAQPSARKENVMDLDPQKLIKPDEVKKLRKYLSQQAKSGDQRAKLRWFIIDLYLGTGLRVSEGMDLKVEDVHVGYGENYIYVREGKGGKSANVIISESLKRHIKRYLAKTKISSEHLLLSERNVPFTRSGLQKLVKRVFEECGLPKRYSVHSLRHTFCSTLYRKTRDLRLVMKQARHASTNTTSIYADLLNEELERGMEGLYEG